MYGLEWRTVYEPQGDILVFIPELQIKEVTKHQNITRVMA